MALDMGNWLQLCQECLDTTLYDKDKRKLIEYKF